MANREQSDDVQFIVVPRTPSSSASVASPPLAELRRVAPSRNVTIVRVVGPDESPRRLIIRGAREQVDQLREEFANDLVIEEDLPVSSA